MFEVIERVPEIDVYNTTGRVIDDVKGDIEFTDVDFAYPTRPEVKVFSGFSIRIEHGTTVALVGESGSGKSTVISLIERFYDPQGGVISLDGVDIRELQLRWLRFQIGLVSQEPVLFGTSIRDNIAYGNDDATPDEIQQAAILANAFTFISQLPQVPESDSIRVLFRLPGKHILRSANKTHCAAIWARKHTARVARRCIRSTRIRSMLES
jgi:ATP-binding cassette subfamily B (MDR/TAP) protein 1